MSYQVLKNSRVVGHYADAEDAIGRIADETGKDREFIAEEIRAGHPILQDDGDQTEWEVLYSRH